MATQLVTTEGVRELKLGTVSAIPAVSYFDAAKDLPQVPVSTMPMPSRVPESIATLLKDGITSTVAAATDLGYPGALVCTSASTSVPMPRRGRVRGKAAPSTLITSGTL